MGSLTQFLNPLFMVVDRCLTRIKIDFCCLGVNHSMSLDPIVFKALWHLTGHPFFRDRRETATLNLATGGYTPVTVEKVSYWTNVAKHEDGIAVPESGTVKSNVLMIPCTLANAGGTGVTNPNMIGGYGG